VRFIWRDGMKYWSFAFASSLFAGTALADDVEQNIKNGLEKIVPSLQIESISPSPIKGLYEVVLGSDIIYMSGDGRYLFKGDLLDIEKKSNLTDQVKAISRAELLSHLHKDEYIEFAAVKPLHTIYVFTDIDCGYCRKLHEDVPALNSLGVNVRYLAYPRAGVESATGQQMAAVWCAEDKQDALTKAKNSQVFDSKTCDAPIESQYLLGRKMGVRGTPAIYLENGESLPGYMPPEKILSAFNSD